MSWVGGTDEGAVGAEDEGVAAVEDGEGRERVEAGVDGADADGGAAEGALEGAVDAGAEGLEAFAGFGEGLAGIVAEDGGGEVGDPVLALAELRGEGGFEAEGKVVEALGLAVQQRGDAGLGAADGQSG